MSGDQFYNDDSGFPQYGGGNQNPQGQFPNGYDQRNPNGENYLSGQSYSAVGPYPQGSHNSQPPLPHGAFPKNHPYNSPHHPSQYPNQQGYPQHPSQYQAYDSYPPHPQHPYGAPQGQQFLYQSNHPKYNKVRPVTWITFACILFVLFVIPMCSAVLG